MAEDRNSKEIGLEKKLVSIVDEYDKYASARGKLVLPNKLTEELHIRHDDHQLWEVYQWLEQDLLSNLLEMMGKYRAKYKAWPTRIMCNSQNRMPIRNSIGDGCVVRMGRWTMKDALYFSLYQPIFEPAEERTPTLFNGVRTPVEDTTGYRYRSRK